MARYKNRNKMTLKQKYNKIHHKKAITDQIAFKLNGKKSGRYLRQSINDETVKPDVENFLHKVFDNHLLWIENVEKKHYQNLCM